MVDIDKAPDLLAFDESEDHRRKLRKWLDGREHPFEVLLEKQYGDEWHIELYYSYKREYAAWNRYTRLMIWAHGTHRMTYKPIKREDTLQLVKGFVEYQREGGEFDFTMYVDAIKEQETE